MAGTIATPLPNAGERAMRPIVLTRGIVLVRACKAMLVAIIAVLITLVALGNLMNYDANWQFVQHVLAMDTIFPGSHLLWRAITNPGLQTAAYLSIIAWEVLSAFVLIVATCGLAANVGNADRFTDAAPLAVLGLTMVIMLFGFGFIAIGGEWFLMWQSSTWNGIEAAFRYVVLTGLTILVLLGGTGNESAP
jgi:predicted small integral membrane protein